MPKYSCIGLNKGTWLSFFLKVGASSVFASAFLFLLTINIVAPMTLKKIIGFCLTTLTAVLAPLSGAEAFSLRPISTYNPMLGEGASEISAYDPISRRLFVTNSQSNTIDLLNISDPTTPQLFKQISIGSYGTDLNYLSSKNGLLAAALNGQNAQVPGSVVLFDTAGNFLRQLSVGPRPDMLTFTPDGRKLIVANEGRANDDYSIDPEGSVSIIDLLAGVNNAAITTADFKAFNGAQLDPSVRIFGPGASVAQDLEPESIAVSPDGTKAYVTLQENNAIAVVDLTTQSITDVFGLGFKDFGKVGLDASDRDDAINIRTYDNLFGMYQPDGVATYEVNGETYIVTANEGDARVFPEDDTDTLEEGETFNEEARIKDLQLDPNAFPAGTDEDELLGRLKVTTTLGDADGDGVYEELYAFGGRSFSIYDSKGRQVFDSGSDFERIIAAQAPELFNVDIDAEDGVEIERTVDGRSDDKGPEPEGISVGKIGDRTYAFISLERSNGIFTYDITDPAKAKFINFSPVAPGDISPEGNLFISAEDSPTGQALLVLSNEISGTTSIYQIDPTPVPEPLATAGLLLSAGILMKTRRRVATP
jgi:2',3'-cyclic-nucleotide 2'-phosphodiesterase / 3'-nucleotidase / 5'-nucleotidase